MLLCLLKHNVRSLLLLLYLLGLSAVWEWLLITQHILLEPSSAARSFAFLILCVAAAVFTFWCFFFYCRCDLPMLMKTISRLPLCGLCILSPALFHFLVLSVLAGSHCFFSKERLSSCKKCIELGMDGVDSDEVKGANCQAVNWPVWAVCLERHSFSFLSEKHFYQRCRMAAGGLSRSDLVNWQEGEDLKTFSPS